MKQGFKKYINMIKTYISLFDKENFRISCKVAILGTLNYYCTMFNTLPQEVIFITKLVYLIISGVGAFLLASYITTWTKKIAQKNRGLKEHRETWVNFSFNIILLFIFYSILTGQTVSLLNIFSLKPLHIYSIFLSISIFGLHLLLFMSIFPALKLLFQNFNLKITENTDDISQEN